MKRAYRLKVYQDRKKEWRWRMTSSNGRIVADSGEGYDNKFNAVRAANKMLKVIMAGRVEMVEQYGSRK